MTGSVAGPRVQTADFRAGDVGYVKRSQRHVIDLRKLLSNQPGMVPR
ncbi:hypothetical protein U2P60_02250 [Brucella sp. H1_1004]